jgi:hypothetical protein
VHPSSAMCSGKQGRKRINTKIFRAQQVLQIPIYATQTLSASR